MLTIDPKNIQPTKLHSYLLGAVIPRPIAFASTIDTAGSVNLSPFSFFNCFGSNPPILVFSPSRKGRDNTVKHTFQNVREVREVVIHIVNHAMVEQMSLTSCEYPKGVNEFIKAGFTQVPSQIVRPPRVAESPVAMECKVNQIIELGQQGGAGNLVICEVLRMHIKDEILDDAGRIDPVKLDAVARMGGDSYLRVQRDNIFSVPKPNEKLGIGFDQIPARIRQSSILTGNDLARLANVEHLPDTEEISSTSTPQAVKEAWMQGENAVHILAQQYLRQGNTQEAWRILLSGKM